MDFIVELWELLEFNIVITIINPVSKRTYFILTHTTTTIENIVLELKTVDFVFKLIFNLFSYLDLELGL